MRKTGNPKSKLVGFHLVLWKSFDVLIHKFSFKMSFSEILEIPDLLQFQCLNAKLDIKLFDIITKTLLIKKLNLFRNPYSDA